MALEAQSSKKSSKKMIAANPMLKVKRNSLSNPGISSKKKITDISSSRNS